MPIATYTADTTVVLLAARGPALDSIVSASRTDPVVQFATECVQFGWRCTHAEFQAQFCFLWPRHSEYRISHQVLLDPDSREFLPESVRSVVLKELHLGYPRAATMAARAPGLLSFPLMRDNVHPHVKLPHVWSVYAETEQQTTPSPGHADSPG